MAAKLHTFFFGRIGIISGLEEPKSDFLYKAVTSNVSHREETEYEYSIFDGDRVNLNTEEFIVGKLLKYKTLPEETFDKTLHQITTSFVKDEIVGKSDFVIHVVSGIIAYRPISGRISDKQFRRIFSRLIEAAYHNFFISISVEAINEDSSIEEQIKEFKKIYSVTINVHPSNPNSRDSWEQLDKRLQNLEASQLSETITGGPGGLNYERLLRDEAYQGIRMAADGYGFASISGKNLQDRDVKISTEENPVQVGAIIDNNSPNLIKQLLKTFQHIINRNGRKQ